MQWRIQQHEVVESTMDVAEAAARVGEPAGLVVVADHQTSGRGRAGRVWSDAPGSSLLLSLLLRPQMTAAELSLFPLMTGVAVAEALEIECRLQPRLKWPNDLLVGDHKIAGVLLSSRLNGDDVDHVVIGIGLNLRPSEAYPPDATSLADEGCRASREVLLDRILQRIGLWLRDLDDGGPLGTIDAWKRRAAWVGERVIVHQPDERLMGTFAGIDASGAALIELAGGERRRVVAGELVRGPRLVGS